METKECKKGIVYVLTNESMPGLVKIGRTSNLEKRLKDLFTTGVPTVFQVEFACEVENMIDVEAALHSAFAPYRKSMSREFFTITPEQPIALLNLLGTNVTETFVNDLANSESDEKVKVEFLNVQHRGEYFDLFNMGFKEGDKLFLNANKDVVVTVENGKSVKNSAGEVLPLKDMTLKYNPVNYNIRPINYWSAEDGKQLRKIYDEVYH